MPKTGTTDYGLNRIPGPKREPHSNASYAPGRHGTVVAKHRQAVHGGHTDPRSGGIGIASSSTLDALHSSSAIVCVRCPPGGECVQKVNPNRTAVRIGQDQPPIAVQHEMVSTTSKAPSSRVRATVE
jgi:hypothetical protein